MSGTYPTELARLLDGYVQAKVARRIGVPRAYVHRLCKGQPLYDDSLIAPLAQVLRVDDSALAELIKRDRIAVRRARREQRKAAA